MQAPTSQSVYRGCWSPQVGSSTPVSFVAPSSQPVQKPNNLVGIVCTNFRKVWDNKQMKKKQSRDISFYRIEPPDGYFRLGDLAEKHHGAYPSGCMLVVKESNPEGAQFPLLAKPIRYAKIWDDSGTGAKFGDLAIYRPVAPAGYVALGDVAWPSQRDEPPLDYMRCVHTSVCVQGKYDSGDVWNDRGAGAKFGDVSMWAPVPNPDVGGSNISTFVAAANYNCPTSNERPPWVLIGPRQS